MYNKFVLTFTPSIPSPWTTKFLHMHSASQSFRMEPCRVGHCGWISRAAKKTIGLETGPARIKQCSQLRRGRGSPRRLPTMPGKCTVSFANIVPLLCLDGVSVRACMHREPIDPNFCVRTTMGRPCTLHRAEKEAWIWIRADIFSFLPRVLGVGDGQGEGGSERFRLELCFAIFKRKGVGLGDLFLLN